jgi:hypothetical protein
MPAYPGQLLKGETMNNCVYVLETIKMLPGKKAEYLSAVEREYLPTVKKHGVRLFAFWETWDLHGDSLEARAMWEFDNWAHVRHFSEARYAKDKIDKDIRGWDERVWTWVVQKEAVCITPSLSTPPLEALLGNGVKAPVAWMEDITTVPGKFYQYCEALEAQLTPIMKAYMNTDWIGYYMECVAWSSNKVFNLWRWDGWDTLDLFDRSATPYALLKGELLPMFREMMNWGEIAFSLRTEWIDRLLVPAPFSPIR